MVRRDKTEIVEKVFVEIRDHPELYQAGFEDVSFPEWYLRRAVSGRTDDEILAGLRYALWTYGFLRCRTKKEQDRVRALIDEISADSRRVSYMQL